jgi:hypothetical protein
MPPTKRAKTAAVSTPAVSDYDDGFMVTISRTTEVVGIDFNMFTDMRPSEQSDARDELDQKMRQYDVDDHLYDCLEEEELPPWVLAKFTTQHGPNWRHKLKRAVPAPAEFETLEEANRAAKEIIEHVLTNAIPRCFDLKHVADGDKIIEEYRIKPELYNVKPKPGSRHLDTYRPAQSDTVAQLVETDEKGLQTYKANYFLYCDPYGADLYNVVAASLTCHVETNGATPEP